jgi:fructose-specific PTS system IIA-like component
MSSEYRFICTLRNGLHARPASMLAETARRFSAEVTIAKGASPGSAIDLRSVLSLVGMDVKFGEECVVIARGSDASAVLAALRELVESRLAEGDEHPPLPDAAPQAATAKLPVGLAKLGVRHGAGRTASKGIGAGAAVVVNGLSLPDELRNARATSIDGELDAARRAVCAVRRELQERAESAGGGIESELLHAHAEIADDPALWSEVERGIRAGATAIQGVVAAAERFSESLRAAQSAYIRDRVLDIQDVCQQLLEHLAGPAIESLQVHLREDSVVFAETLTPSQLLKLDKSRLKGLVLGRIGATAHTVILARSNRIPTILDVAAPTALAISGTPVILDATAGFVITEVAPAVSRYYERERRAIQRSSGRLAPLAQRPAVTRDGVRIEVGINASTADEVVGGIAQGAEGVGLLRTELLFLDRASAPGEDEQAQAYTSVVVAAAGRPVIIRTFDIGGDKPATYLRMPKEENPFLGCRGLRLYEQHPALLRTQLRAILRASASGPVKIMAPMVATPGEARWFREQVRATQDELRAAGTRFDESAPVGVMIEIPATALVMDQLSAEVDFFSIGTNDLCQYWMAVDRGNASVAPLYNARQPSFLRLLRTIVQGARAGGRWIGVCGEMASDRLNLPLMIALGLDEISVAPGEVPGLKVAAQNADAGRCRELLDAACTLPDAASVEALLRTFDWRSPDAGAGAVVAEEMIEVAGDAASKEEAIKDAVDLLFIAGRTERPRAVEEAVWAREATYSTGLGYGFAIPHCKTDAVDRPTLAVLKLRAPVEWGSMDGKAVETVMLLAVPAADTSGAHMKVFAKLARKLMHEGFRDSVSSAGTPAAVLDTLRRELDLA